MVADSEEIGNPKFSLDRPHTENAEKFLTIPASSIVGNGASEGYSVSSLYKPCSLPLKDEKIEFDDLRAMGIPKEVNVKRLMLEKQNKLEAAKIKNEISPVVSPAFDRREVPSDVVSRAAASVSKNPAFIRALAIIKEDLKLLQDLKHKSVRGLAKGGASPLFLKSPKKEKDPMKRSEWPIKEEIPARPAETISINPLKKVKVETDTNCEKYLEWSL